MVSFINIILFSFVIYCSLAEDIKTKDQDSCPYGTFSNGTGCEVCGLNHIRNKRVLGGLEAKPHAFPGHALVVQRFKVDSHGRKITFQCGGALINHYTILTAAHCVTDTKDLNYDTDYFDNKDGESKTTTPKVELESTFSVYLGAHDIAFSKKDNQSEIPESVKLVKVEKVIKHENYDPDNLLNDIALLILAERIDEGPNVSPACLPKQASNTYPPANFPIYGIGWGDTRESGASSQTLLYAKLRVYDFDLCVPILPDYKKNPKTQVCVGYYPGLQDTCTGDSGGSAYIYERISEQNRIIASAIVSYGDGCGRNKVLAVYTRVSHYLDWIKENWKII